jgi:hypothetical protein
VANILCHLGPSCYGQCCAPHQYCSEKTGKCATPKGQIAPCKDQKGTKPCVDPGDGSVQCCSKTQHCAASEVESSLTYYCSPNKNPSECPGGKTFKRKDKRGQPITICCPNGTTPARDPNGLWSCQ